MQKKQQPKNPLTGLMVLAFAILVLVTVAPNRTIGGQASAQPSQPNCVDSDSGLNYASSGAVSGRRVDGITYQYSDRCGNGMVLYERSCEGALPTVQMYRCEGGCSVGACR